MDQLGPRLAGARAARASRGGGGAAGRAAPARPRAQQLPSDGTSRAPSKEVMAAKLKRAREYAQQARGGAAAEGAAAAAPAAGGEAPEVLGKFGAAAAGLAVAETSAFLEAQRALEAARPAGTAAPAARAPPPLAAAPTALQEKMKRAQAYKAVADARAAASAPAAEPTAGPGPGSEAAAAAADDDGAAAPPGGFVRGGTADVAANWLRVDTSEGFAAQVDSAGLSADAFTAKVEALRRAAGATIERASGKVEGTRRTRTEMGDYGLAQQTDEASASLAADAAARERAARAAAAVAAAAAADGGAAAATLASAERDAGGAAAVERMMAMDGRQSEEEDAAAEAEASGAAADGSHRPAVATWGVFPRPKNISEAYGGGRNLRPGQRLESEEAAAVRARRTAAALAGFRSAAGLDIDPEVEAAARRVYERGAELLKAGALGPALEQFDAAAGALPLKSRLGGEARLQKAICLDSLDRGAEAYQVYKSLKGHSAPGVAKTAGARLRGGLGRRVLFLCLCLCVLALLFPCSLSRAPLFSPSPPTTRSAHDVWLHRGRVAEGRHDAAARRGRPRGVAGLLCARQRGRRLVGDLRAEEGRRGGGGRGGGGARGGGGGPGSRRAAAGSRRRARARALGARDCARARVLQKRRVVFRTGWPRQVRCNLQQRNAMCTLWRHDDNY
jgi:hypothetical protein